MTYDFVIVGAGSAGCVLAARLSEDHRVLLLEAGPPDDAPEIAVPAAFATLFSGSRAWPDATTDGVPWPHGRTLGGSSSINGMVYMRGHPLDYDDWRDEHGCDGWGHEDLLPCFERAERRLSVELPVHTHPLSRAWMESALAHGLRVGPLNLTMRDGRRWSAADAYLRPRPNLEIVTDAHVTEVVIERGRAVGVRYGDREARAGEVLLCAGAVKSPQLLMLSGVGPAAHLAEHGIDPVVDAPRVGQGLQDHPLCLPEWRTPRTPSLWEQLTPESLERWQRDRRGPNSSGGAEVGGFARSRLGLPAPDLQLGTLPGPAPDAELTLQSRRGVAQVTIVVDVRSRGSLRLRSADPFDRPAIDPRYLSERADFDAMLAGVRLAREISAREPLAGLIDGELAPGEDDLERWIRASVGTAFHPSSTCAMGGDDDAVVDPQLRVRGVDGLRVVDASVMPKVPRGNTNGPTIALAERAAELILSPPARGTRREPTRTPLGTGG